MNEHDLERPLFVPVSQRIGFLYVEHARIEVSDGAVMAVSDDSETPIPSGNTTCLLLGPGTSVTHSAITALARAECLVVWTGEFGVRVYSAGKPGQAQGKRAETQFETVRDPNLRLAAARRMYRLMLEKDSPSGRSIDQLRGLEGTWVKSMYERLASISGIIWRGRDFKNPDPINRAISQATSTLYCVTEAALLASGFLPSLGIVHRGNNRSFVFDITDTVKFRTVVPLAFRVVSDNPSGDLCGRIRRSCRDLFVREKLIGRLVDIANHVVLGYALDSR